MFREGGGPHTNQEPTLWGSPEDDLYSHDWAHRPKMDRSKLNPSNRYI